MYNMHNKAKYNEQTMNHTKSHNAEIYSFLTKGIYLQLLQISLGILYEITAQNYYLSYPKTLSILNSKMAKWQ